MWKWLVASGVVAVAIGAGVLLRPGTGAPPYADPSDPRLVGLGRQVYAQQCASCHGADLQGQPNWQTPLPSGGRPAPPHDETGHTWHHPDALLFELTKYGGQAYSPPEYRNNMPAFESILTDEEITAALAFIKSQWPPQVQTQQERVNRRVESR